MTINVNNATEIKEAIGKRTHGCCKPVICIDTGEVFASATDAAEAIGVTSWAMSNCCLGKARTCKGKRYSYVSKTSENLDVLTAFIRTQNARMAELEADAAIGRVIREEQEAKQKAEEQRLKTLEDARTAYEKAKAKFERRERMLMREDEKYQQLVSRYIEAETEMHETELKLLELEGVITTRETEETKQ